MISFKNFQKAQFLPNRNLEQKSNKACISNSLAQDTVSFKMSYRDYSNPQQEEAPKIDGNRCIINMGRKSKFDYKGSIEEGLIGKDLKLNRKSTLMVDPLNSTFKTVKVNSLEMETGSQINVFLGFPFEVEQNATIKDNCAISAKSVIFNNQTTIGNEFVTGKIEGKEDLDIGNSCRIGSIDTQGSKLCIGDNAKIGSIEAKGNIDISKNFTPITRDCKIVSQDGTIFIGSDIRQLKLSEVQDLAGSNDLCHIETIKTPKALVLGAQTQKVINNIEAGSIYLIGDATVNKVKLDNSIIKITCDSEHILTVLTDVIVPSSTKSDKNREITLENTVIKQDLIIDKNSGVTKINLKNVNVEGVVVLENPNVEIVKDDKTVINDIWKQED